MSLCACADPARTVSPCQTQARDKKYNCLSFMYSSCVLSIPPWTFLAYVFLKCALWWWILHINACRYEKTSRFTEFWVPLAGACLGWTTPNDSVGRTLPTLALWNQVPCSPDSWVAWQWQGQFFINEKLNKQQNAFFPFSPRHSRGKNKLSNWSN